MNRLERPTSSANRTCSEQMKDLFYASQSTSEFMSAVDQIRQPTDGCTVDRLVPTNNGKGKVGFEKKIFFSSSGSRKIDNQSMNQLGDASDEVDRERPSRKVRKEATPKFNAPSEKRNSSVSRSTNGSSFIGTQNYSSILNNALKSEDIASIGKQNELINDDDKGNNTRYTIKP